MSSSARGGDGDHPYQPRHPADALAVPCKVAKGEGRSHDCILYVDITGVTFVDGATRQVTQRAAFNEITSWCAEAPDRFRLKCFGRAGKLTGRGGTLHPELFCIYRDWQRIVQGCRPPG